MGLGAFTKVVGDAGVTVAKQAPLPVTTGNSYSASGALWSLPTRCCGAGIADVDEQGRLRGNAMVVGPPVQISSVCAGGCWQLANGDLWLVSPRSADCSRSGGDRSATTRGARIHVAATRTEHLAEMDVIVTRHLGVSCGKRVLDIAMAVKPGCVITDVGPTAGPVGGGCGQAAGCVLVVGVRRGSSCPAMSG